jgi:hypothetical protein
MSRHVAITANVATATSAEIPALFAPLLDALGEQLTDLREPVSYDWKIPGTWMATADLGVVPGDDGQDIVARLVARLPLTDWHVSGDKDVADAVWAAKDDAAAPFPGIGWILIEASHPPDPDAEPPEIEELGPLIPPDLTESDIADLMEMLAGSDDKDDRKDPES